MMSMISKSDIESELQISLPAGYPDSFIESIADTAEDWLKIRANRTTFTGSADKLAAKYVLFATVDRLLTTNPDLVKTDVRGISENGSSITFADTGRSIKDYAAEAEIILKQLVIRPRGAGFTYANETTFY
jgi:hypothetical protein